MACMMCYSHSGHDMYDIPSPWSSMWCKLSDNCRKNLSLLFQKACMSSNSDIWLNSKQQEIYDTNAKAYRKYWLSQFSYLKKEEQNQSCKENMPASLQNIACPYIQTVHWPLYTDHIYVYRLQLSEIHIQSTQCRQECHTLHWTTRRMLNVINHFRENLEALATCNFPTILTIIYNLYVNEAKEWL